MNRTLLNLNLQRLTKTSCIALLLGLFTSGNAVIAQDGFRPLFNGESFEGWTQRGGKAEYSIEDGVIVGTSVPSTPNSFLCTEKEYGDFILDLEYKVDPLLNSGIQIRSLVYPEDHKRAGVVHGYQVEIDPSDRAWSAGIYDESRRGWLYNLEDNPAAQAAFKQNEWNHYRIACIGNSIRTWINGVPAANLLDDMTAKGFIALQVHGVGGDKNKVGKQIQWRNIRIRELDADQMDLLIGTYTGGDSKGIYKARLDLAEGKLGEPELVAELKNPSFVAIHPEFDKVYAVSEISDLNGKPTGGVVAFRINPESGKLERINEQPSGGAGPCFVNVDLAGNFVLIANYGGGSVSSYPITEEGGLGESASFVQHEGSSINSQRQEGPHAHSINLDPNNRFAFVADLGLDKVIAYDFSPETGELSANEKLTASTPQGGGPRHFSFHPNRKFAYTNNELTSSVTVLAFDTKQQTMKPIQTISTLPEDFDQNNSTAEVLVHPSGKFVYCSNRGHDSIAVFAVDPKAGTLESKGFVSSGGKTPRNFAIDPSGRYLLAENQSTNNIVVFLIDKESGMLEPTGSEIMVGAPVCIRFLPVDAE